MLRENLIGGFLHNNVLCYVGKKLKSLYFTKLCGFKQPKSTAIPLFPNDPSFTPKVQQVQILCKEYVCVIYEDGLFHLFNTFERKLVFERQFEKLSSKLENFGSSIKRTLD
jgi:hypothetical protein